MRHARWLVMSGFLLTACASPGAPIGGPSGAPATSTRSTDDPRVRPLLGQVPPDVSADVRMLDGPPTSLAALRGRVVFLQFAFPT